MSDIVINAHNVSKYYKLYDSPRDRLIEALNPLGKLYHKKYYALKNIDLEVKKGELLGIVGKNGCGKSTLLKVISGVLCPDSGQVKVQGKISALLELGSGFNPEFTGIQNIYFYGVILGLSRRKIDSMLDDILSFADIGEYIHQPLKTYSSGMRARLGFSVATAIRPEILILDEVLSVGDAQFRKKSAVRMLEMMNSGCTVLLVSHSENSINQLCTKAIYIRDGEIAVKGTPKNVTKLYLKTSGSKKLISNEKIREEMVRIENGDVSSVGGDDEGLIDDSFFSPGVFKLSKPVVVENFPVELIEVSILNKNNKKVNMLRHGREYRLVLKYKFNEAADDVVFPVSFYTGKGQLIFGVRNPNDGSAYTVARGESVEVAYDFVCQFLQRDYYISVGVTRLLHDDKEILLRIEDALSYKVLDDQEAVHWGMVSPVILDLKYRGSVDSSRVPSE